ncbi:MAG: hypothetical protein U0Q16_16820 [Bryobacteraceae bacterium]
MVDAVAIGAGDDHTCALRVGGTVRCWGANDYGQLGDNTQTTRRTPVDVLGLANVTAISAAGSHTCALIADGTARCWGRNVYGELGTGKTTSSKIPVPVQGLSSAVAIETGAFHTCALIADGSVRCWGRNIFGQLGNNSTVDQSSPVPVLGITNVKAITSGGSHTCALLADGTARCWGWNFQNQLGDGSGNNSPVAVPVSLLGNAVAITAGGAHTCALLADGSARCWGTNSHGELGNGGTLPTSVLTAVAGGGGSITARAVAAGRDHTCVVRANSTAACWGANASGQVGTGVVGGNSIFPQAIPGLTNVTAIAGGEAHTCALLADGTVRCWGQNSSGEIGDGTNTTRPSPVPVPGLANVVGIATGGDLGGSHTCALIADGTVRCWGANNNGQLGDATQTPRRTPTVVQGLGNATAIAAGAFHTCALVADGTARCWGTNTNGQLGNGSTNPSNVPVTVAGLGAAVGIASGDAHNCAIIVDGTARCWGANLVGQLGAGFDTSPQPLALVVKSLLNATVIAAGGSHSCAAFPGFNDVRCWGSNTFHEVSSVVDSSVLQPVPTPGSLNITLATGRHHSCALDYLGSVKCWGDNTFGQLGTLQLSTTTTTVPSLTLNIDPAVSAKPNLRVAEVNVIAIRERASASGVRHHPRTGHGGLAAAMDRENATGRVEPYPVTVPAHGPNPFGGGAGTVSAEAVIRGGNGQETQAWTRAVNITVAP